MRKFQTRFRGVPAGEIYPVEYAPGDDCPECLVEAAEACGALEPLQQETTKKARAAK